LARHHVTVVGVIADTHGLLRPSAIAAMRGSDLILHAGDIGKPGVLEALRALAPVTAIRGNVDSNWASALPDTVTLTVQGSRILVLHDLKTLACDPQAEGFAVVVSGHSHRPHLDRRDGVLFVNPGSAGPRRFKLPICVARLEIAADSMEARIVEIAP
jgi:putative phosphoesterase